MKLKINGRSEEIPDSISILELLKMKSLNPELVAVQHNGGILQKDCLATQMLKEADELEVLHFMGGGQC